VDDLEEGRVAVGGQRALAFRPYRSVDLLVGVVQEPLQLLSRERARLRTPPRRDRVFLQLASRLLGSPALEHRLDHRVLGTQLHHAGDELQARCTR
jgi:hypothetical protein